MNDKERLQMDLFIANDAIGDLNLEGSKINCEKCKNRGYNAFIEDGYITYRECECMFKRKNWLTIKNSGLEHVIKQYTFDNYKVTEKWQEHVLKLAKDYATNHKNNWFYIGGQIGSGKTMICTSIVGDMLSRNIQVVYMIWRDELRKLKSLLGTNEYSNNITKLQKAKVLYIDDFFKGDKLPSSYDTDIAFEILNYRYNNRLPTLISSEYVLDAIMKENQAIGSRIFELTGTKYLINLQDDVHKNTRLNGTLNR